MAGVRVEPFLLIGNVGTVVWRRAALPRFRPEQRDRAVGPVPWEAHRICNQRNHFVTRNIHSSAALVLSSSIRVPAFYGLRLII